MRAVVGGGEWAAENFLGRAAHLVKSDISAIAGRHELPGDTVHDPDEGKQSNGGRSKSDDVHRVDEAVNCVVSMNHRNAELPNGRAGI